MTTNLTENLKDLSLSAETFLDTIDDFTEPSDELINWVTLQPSTALRM